MTSASAPRPVRAAAALLVAYGVAVMAGAAWLQPPPGILAAPTLVRALIRCLAVVLIASQLLSRRRWSWLVAVVVAGLWAFTGIFGATGYWLSGGLETNLISVPVLWFTVGVSAILVGLLALLFSRPVRVEWMENARGRTDA